MVKIERKHDSPLAAGWPTQVIVMLTSRIRGAQAENRKNSPQPNDEAEDGSLISGLAPDSHAQTDAMVIP
jgi:hypothetical protein